MSEQVLKFVKYIRKSSESENKQENSIETQLSILKEYQELENLNIVETFSESKSAWNKGKRKEFNRMVKFFRLCKANALLTNHVNRIARNLSEAGIFEEFVKKGIVKEIRTPHKTYKTKKDLMDLVNEWANAVNFSTNNSIVVSQAIESHLKRGKLVSRRIGYKFDKDHNLVPDEQESRLIKTMFNLYNTGKHSFKTLAEELYLLGYRASNGVDRIRPNKLHKYIKDPIYYGAITYKGKLLHERGIHEPLITKKEYELAQKIRKGKGKSRNRKHEALYRGKVSCGECFCCYTYDPKKNRHGKLYEYYRDTNSKKAHPNSPKSIQEKDLDIIFGTIFETINIDKELMDLSFELYKEELEEKAKGNDDLKQIQKRIDSLNEELIKLKRKYTRDEFTKEEYEELKQEIQNEISVFSEKQNEINNEDLSVTFELLENVKAEALSLPKLFIDGEKPVKKIVLDKLVSNLLLIQGKPASIHYKMPFAAIEYASKSGDMKEWRRGGDSNPR